MYESQRKRFERRWYDNYFFDDGFHFRYLSQTTGQIVDLSSSYLGIPTRSIPKASRQIRGIANLLMQPEYMPTVFPERLPPNLPPEIQEQMRQQAHDTAKQKGWWLENEWDDENLKQKMIDMLIKAAKCGISYIKAWGDPDDNKINTKIYDAFDIFHRVDIEELAQTNIIINSYPRQLEEIINDPLFQEYEEGAFLNRVTPDNKFAASAIKDSYMRQKFNRQGGSSKKQEENTSIQDEAFIRECLDENNWKLATKDLKDTGFMDGKSKGDFVIRQVFQVGGDTLYDKYIERETFPFRDFRFEPGAIYQTPLIERFIPQNKSLDIVASRVEHWVGTQAIGIIARRKGENFKITNLPGGQQVEYEGTPPQFINPGGMPNTVWNFIGFLQNLIDEQGVSAATGDLPQGVKSGVAIESVKAAEYANLKIPADMLKLTIKGIAEMCLEIADYSYSQPKPIETMQNDKVETFNVIGDSASKNLQQIKDKTFDSSPVNAIKLSKDSKVVIEVQSGLGFTYEGKVNRMQQIADYMRTLAAEGYLTQDQVQGFVKKMLEVFQYGATSEFFDMYENGVTPMTVKQIEEIKVAVLSVINDLQKTQTPAPIPGEEQPATTPSESTEEDDIMKIKTGVVEALRDIKQGGVSA